MLRVGADVARVLQPVQGLQVVVEQHIHCLKGQCQTQKATGFQPRKCQPLEVCQVD